MTELAIEGGRPPTVDNLTTLFEREGPVGLDRPAALRIAMRVDLEIFVPEPPSGKLPDLGQRSTDAVGEVLSGIPAFRDLIPTFDERERTRKERETEEQTRIEDESRAVLQAIVALDWELTRNPPAEPDTLTVVIPSRMLPVDLRVFDSIRIQAWPFVRNAANETFEDRLDRCLPGDPGHFAGIVDNVETNRTEGTLTLTCRDLTAILTAEELNPKTIRGLNMKDPIEDLVAVIIEDSVPGGENWRVEQRGKLRTAIVRTPARLLSDEKKVRRTTQKVDLVAHTKVETGKVKELPNYEQRTVAEGLREGDLFEDMELLTVRKTESGKMETWQGRLPYNPAAFANETEYEVRNVTRMVTQRIPPKPTAVFGAQKQTVWGAITRACRKLSIVAEVTLSESGEPTVVLVDAEDYLDGRFFRWFERDGRRHRIVTYGRDLAELAESRDLTAGDRVDWVEVEAIDPDTGEVRRERFGKRRRGGHNSGQILQAHGFTDRKALKRLARAAWLNLNQGELQLGVEIDNPWTTGGGVDDPDLLQCAAGAIIEVAFASAQRFRGRSLEDILRGPPIYMPAQPARVLAKASERAEPSLVFQVAELVHSGSGEGSGEYRCSMNLQTLLDDGINPDELEVDDT
jgi:hypothetical protein